MPADRCLQPKRRADGDHPVSDLHPIRVAEPCELELGLAVVELEHREIRLLVGADDLRLVLAAVERDDLDLRRLFDDVRVGERDPARVHDHARAEAALRNALRSIAEEPFEEVLTEELFERRAAAAAEGPAFRHRVDVDDRRFDDLRDAGEAAGVERHLHGQHGRGWRSRLQRALGAPAGDGAERDAGHEHQHERRDEIGSLELHHGIHRLLRPLPRRPRR
jgi:hypothetical protein